MFFILNCSLEDSISTGTINQKLKNKALKSNCLYEHYICRKKEEKKRSFYLLNTLLVLKKILKPVIACFLCFWTLNYLLCNLFFIFFLRFQLIINIQRIEDQGLVQRILAFVLQSSQSDFIQSIKGKIRKFLLSSIGVSSFLVYFHNVFLNSKNYCCLKSFTLISVFFVLYFLLFDFIFFQKEDFISDIIKYFITNFFIFLCFIFLLFFSTTNLGKNLISFEEKLVSNLSNLQIFFYIFLFHFLLLFIVVFCTCMLPYFVKENDPLYEMVKNDKLFKVLLKKNESSDLLTISLFSILVFIFSFI